MSPSRARSNSHASTNSNSGSSSTKKKINTSLFHPTATAMFEGQELIILTTAEPLLTPVPSSEVVIQGTVIMAWHPSHSSQREARSIFSLISEKAYIASSSLSLASFLSAWGSGSSGSNNKKRNNRNNSSGLFFASNISTIAMGIVLLLTLTLMVALYLDGEDGPVGFNRHTEGGPPFVHWAYKDNNGKSKNKNENKHKPSRSSSAREKQKQQQQQQPGETEEERVIRFQKEHDAQHRNIINKWDNAVDDEQKQLMITDHGIPIRYDLDPESLLAFRKMTRRAQTAGNDIKTIANTDRQFILAVSGEELDGGEVATSSTTAAGSNNGLREVLLCNKPTDNEQLNEAIRSQKVLSQVSFMNEEESLSSQKKEKRSSKEKFTIADVSPSGNGIGNIGGNGIYNSGFSVGYGPKTVLDRPINPITSRHRLDPKFDYDNEDSNNNENYGNSNYLENQIDMRDDAQKQNNEMDAHTRKFMDGGACITATLSSLSKPTAEAGHAVAAEKIASSQTFQLSLQQNQNNKQEGGFVSSLSGSGSSEDHDHQNYQAIPNSPYEAEPYEEPLVQQLGSSM